MDSKLAMFSILVLAAVFSVALPMNSVYAQTSDIYPDSEDEIMTENLVHSKRTRAH